MAQEYLPAPSNVRLADLMKEHNISQPELAKEIGCSKSTISRFISGAKGTLTHEQVLKIARLFNVSTDLHYFVSVIKACKPSECVDRTSMEWDVVLFSGIFRCHLYGNAVRFFAGYRSLHCMESIKWKCQRSRISQSSADCPMRKSESFH